MTKKSPVAKRLRQARELKGISQKALGILAGIDQFAASARVNQYERDKHVPDYATSIRLAKALEVPVTFLYADDDDLAEMILLFAYAGPRKRTQAKKTLTKK